MSWARDARAGWTFGRSKAGPLNLTLGVLKVGTVYAYPNPSYRKTLYWEMADVIVFLVSSLLCLCPAIGSSSAPLSPFALRIDLQESPPATAQPAAGLFIALDETVGNGPNISLAWALPSAFVSQISFNIKVTRPTSISGANTTVFVSGVLASTSQLFAGLPRTELQPATTYSIQVMVSATLADSQVVASAWSAPLRFSTSAGPAHWASSAAVWPAPCTTNAAPPKFALFHADVPVHTPPGADGLLSALVFVTASPPIYNDPWNVTKLFSGFKVRVNGALVGLGPGHTACGPYAMSSCRAVQPVDAFDITALAGAGPSVALDLSAYGLTQPNVAVLPALQLVVVLRFSPEGIAPDAVFGTAAAPKAGWLALDADGLYNPSGNKDSGWYLQPREDLNLACLPPLPSAALSGTSSLAAPLNGCHAPYGTCGWAPPVLVPGAFANFAGGVLPLAGKTTQALQLHEGLPLTVRAQFGRGWWLLDPGFELQGGFALQLLPAAATVAPNGVLAIVQLADELATNGSALWNTRAGMHYQDAWRFPPPATATAAQLAAEHHEMCEFRYSELILTDPTTGQPLALEPGVHFVASLWRVYYRYDDNAAATVRTTSADLDAVFALCAFTLKTTTMSIYSDSNTRQRSFDCMADDTVAALSHYHTTSELALPRMMAAQIMSIGDHGYISGNWADWTVLPGLNVVHDALYTGDLSFAAVYFDALVANHTYAWLVDPATGLVTAGWLGALVDTSGGSDDGFQGSSVNTIVNAWCYLGMRRTAQLGRWLGRTAAADTLDATAARLQAAMKAYMFNGTAMCDGLCKATPHTSVHSTFYTLSAGVAEGDPALTHTLASYVRRRAVQDPDLGVPCGSYPVQFLLAGLYADSDDHGNAAYGVLTSAAPHSYLHMMQAFGATATMECWLPSELPNLSFSHVWSSSPAFIIPQFFFGVTPTSPGYATADVKPQPGPVLVGTASLPTVRGALNVSFSQTMAGPGGCMAVSVGVPGGMAVRIFLPRWGLNVSVVQDGVAVPSTVDGDYVYVAGVSAGAHVLTSC